MYRVYVIPQDGVDNEEPVDAQDSTKYYRVPIIILRETKWQGDELNATPSSLTDLINTLYFCSSSIIVTSRSTRVVLVLIDKKLMTE